MEQSDQLDLHGLPPSISRWLALDLPHRVRARKPTSADGHRLPKHSRIVVDGKGAAERVEVAAPTAGLVQHGADRRRSLLGPSGHRARNRRRRRLPCWSAMAAAGAPSQTQSSDTRRRRGGCHSTYHPPHVRLRRADPTCRSTPLIRCSASATASASAAELNPYHQRRPRDRSKGRGRHAPDVYSRGMTVSTRVRWVRNSSMKLRRKTAVASLATSPSSVKTSGEYWM